MPSFSLPLIIYIPLICFQSQFWLIFAWELLEYQLSFYIFCWKYVSFLRCYQHPFLQFSLLPFSYPEKTEYHFSVLHDKIFTIRKANEGVQVFRVRIESLLASWHYLINNVHFSRLAKGQARYMTIQVANGHSQAWKEVVFDWVIVPEW